VRTRVAVISTAAMELSDLKSKIRDIKDFPTEGVLFKDITTLLREPQAFKYVVTQLALRYIQERVELVVAIESRGFIFGGALAAELGAGFVPVRKLGKLPGKTIEVEYELEYGGTPWRSTRTPSEPASGCWPWTTCSPPGGPWPPPSG